MAEPSLEDKNDDSNDSQDSQAATFGDSPDVIFIFPNNGGATVSVQKFMLMNSSEVFKKQFSFSSSGNEEPTRIAITDITFDTFKQFMWHIHGIFDGDDNSINIYEDNYLELLYASRKYFVNDLTLEIIRFIIEFINENNLSEHYEFIEKFDIKMLNDHMKKICIRSPLKIIGQLSTSEPHKRILKMILESPRLPCTEYALYNAVKEMFEKGEHRVFDNEIFRKDLGNLIYLIRFPLMTVTELISCGIKPSPLTAEELLDLLLFVQEDLFSNTIQFFSRESRQDETPKFCKHCRHFEEVCQKCKKAY